MPKRYFAVTLDWWFISVSGAFAMGYIIASRVHGTYELWFYLCLIAMPVLAILKLVIARHASIVVQQNSTTKTTDRRDKEMGDAGDG